MINILKKMNFTWHMNYELRLILVDCLWQDLLSRVVKIRIELKTNNKY